MSGTATPPPTDDAPSLSAAQLKLRRLHSLAGVVPLGLFVVLHLATNALALSGRDAYNDAQGWIQSFPFLGALELLLIGVPLTFHAAYGIALAARGSVDRRALGHTRDWLYALQRASGAAAFVFIALHLWHLRLPRLLGALGWQQLYGFLGDSLSEAATFAAYVLGVSACVYHLAHGLWLAGGTWGLTVTPKTLRRSAWGCGVFGLLLWALSINTLLHFSYRCGGLIPLPEETLSRACRDADTAAPGELVP